MTMDEDREGMAVEYALGTLDADERAQAEALLLVDPEFAAEVQRWERRLGELNALVAPVEPPASCSMKSRERRSCATGLQRPSMKAPSWPKAWRNRSSKERGRR